MQDRKMQDWILTDQIAGLENARLQYDGPHSRAGKCRTGNCRTGKLGLENRLESDGLF